MIKHPWVAVVATVALTTAAHAHALPCAPPQTAQLSAFDTERMAGFVQSRTRGLAEALVAESVADRDAVSAIFAAGFAPATEVPPGAYRCRTIKLGGNLPLVAYDSFACRIGPDGTSIEKTSGSQRFAGMLTPSNGSFFYRGALHYSDEQPLDYGVNPERDQVGCLSEIAGGGGHFVLELPSPRLESRHDLIELVPVR